MDSQNWMSHGNVLPIEIFATIFGYNPPSHKTRISATAALQRNGGLVNHNQPNSSFINSHYQFDLLAYWHLNHWNWTWPRNRRQIQSIQNLWFFKHKKEGSKCMGENSSSQMGRFCRQWQLKIRICCHDSDYLSDSGMCERYIHTSSQPPVDQNGFYDLI